MRSEVQPDHADVVVIGGGILGCCAAYHLQQAGVGRVVLLEREADLATQTTYAGAGFVALWRATAQTAEPDLSLERYALQFYNALEARHPIGLKRVGLLAIATTADGAARLQQEYARARARLSADEVALLDPHAVHNLAPIVDPAHVIAALYSPTALRVDAALATRAIGDELRAAGVDVRTSVAVIGIEIDDGRIVAVETTAGPIVTRRVVDAAGAWLQEVARMAGVSFPLVPLPASRFITAPINDVPADLPLLMFSDYHNLYIREEGGGLLIGTEEIVVHPPTLMQWFGHEWGVAAKRDDHNPMPDRVQALPDMTHQYHTLVARNFAHVVPMLQDFSVQDIRFGMPTRTPDLQHLFGQVSGVDGLYIIGGDYEVGVTHAPGLGHAMAELIVHGRTSLDLSLFRLDRWR